MQRAGAGGPDSQLVFLLPNREPWCVYLHNETCDSPIALQRDKFHILHSSDTPSYQCSTVLVHLHTNVPQTAQFWYALIPMFHRLRNSGMPWYQCSTDCIVLVCPPTNVPQFWYTFIPMFYRLHSSGTPSNQCSTECIVVLHTAANDLHTELKCGTPSCKRSVDWPVTVHQCSVDYIVVVHIPVHVHQIAQSCYVHLPIGWSPAAEECLRISLPSLYYTPCSLKS